MMVPLKTEISLVLRDKTQSSVCGKMERRKKSGTASGARVRSKKLVLNRVAYLLGDGFQNALDGFRMEHGHFGGVKNPRGKNGKKKFIAVGPGRWTGGVQWGHKRCKNANELRTRTHTRATGDGVVVSSTEQRNNHL